MRFAIRFHLIPATVLFIVLFSTLMLSASASTNQENALLSISEADVSLAQAHEDVLDAEEAGADISGLLEKLGVAGEYLAEAHIRYRIGDFGNATHYASLCYEVVEEARGEIYRTKNAAYELWVAGLFFRVIGAFIGVALVVLLGYMVWRAFKRRYQRRILELKLEMVSDES